MKIKLKLFGILAEEANENEVEFSFDQPMSIVNFVHRVEDMYPKLKKYEYQLAINQQITNDKTQIISADTEIAFLPPFAGG